MTPEEEHDQDWEDAPADPDPVEHLGYERIDLDVFEVNDGTGRYMFLPMEEDLLEDEAFIVASDGAVDALGERR